MKIVTIRQRRSQAFSIVVRLRDGHARGPWAPSHPGHDTLPESSRGNGCSARQVHTDTATSQCAGLLGRRATKVTYLRFETTGRC